MFLFVPAPTSLDTITRDGLHAADGELLTLWTSLDALPDDVQAPTLIVNTDAMDAPPHRAHAHRVQVPSVPPRAIQNVDPYLPPKHVVAAGGYVMRTVDGHDEPALLLIHRKGVWDLPKGKQEPGETLEECAVREVREEVGIRTLKALRPLGTTLHTFPVEDAYKVKTTHWYLMRTPERSFEPERREGIRRVTWARWPVARRHIGYRSLATHMDQIDATVHDVVQNGILAGSGRS